MADAGPDTTRDFGWSVFDDRKEFDPAPAWISAMFSIGRILAEQHTPDRPWLAVLSAPVKSSAAGLIALAAQAYTNDSCRGEVSYYDFLCGLPRGTPMRCRRRPRTRGFHLTYHDFGGPTPLLCVASNGRRDSITPLNCNDWEPWDRDLLKGFAYAHAPDSAATALLQAILRIRDDDAIRLRRQSTAVAFVGPTGGATEYSRAYREKIGFFLKGTEYRRSLADLLGLRDCPFTPDGQAWGGTYINPLSRSTPGKCESLAESTAIAIFDGIQPFQRFGDHFYKSSRIVVVSRAVANDTLFGFCQKLEQLRQDFGLNSELPVDMPNLPNLLLFDSVRRPPS
jgi:hypothetical protein